MRTNLIALAAVLYTLPCVADDSNTQRPHSDEHGGQIFHAFTLEMDSGAGRDDTISTWDFDGWIGGDNHKLWLKSEGEMENGHTHDAEFWGMYSYNISTFWDAQTGIRFDSEPRATSYVVAGVSGLAPYWFETEAHMFVSDDGDVSARLHTETDLMLTQQLVVQPYVEVNVLADNVPELETGAGVTNGEIGIQTRYEITRKFAPYFDIRYERKFGKTASISIGEGEHRDDFIASAGLRLMF
jgi:copper resistance protein B